jgi:hypothetical protein
MPAGAFCAAKHSIGGGTTSCLWQKLVLKNAEFAEKLKKGRGHCTFGKQFLKNANQSAKSAEGMATRNIHGTKAANALFAVKHETITIRLAAVVCVLFAAELLRQIMLLTSGKTMSTVAKDVPSVAKRHIIINTK